MSMMSANFMGCKYDSFHLKTRTSKETQTKFTVGDELCYSPTSDLYRWLDAEAHRSRFLKVFEYLNM